MPRIFFVTDVHASERCFRKFLNAAKVYRADTLILGGDITGKVLVPIVENGAGKYTLTLFGEHVTVSRDGLEECKKKLLDAGQYYIVTTESEMAEMASDRSKADRAFNEAILSRLKSWLALAEERLRGTGVKCYISPGNDDRFEVDSVLKDGEHVINPENSVVELDGGYEMITLGYANPTPWKSPREVPEERLAHTIDALASKLSRPELSLFNLHVPPVNTEIDKAPAVDDEFRYVKEGLGIKFIHAGSTAVRSAIERYQPLVGLHGHIHESKGFVRIGRTLCLNPGSEYSDGILRGALLNLEGGRLKEFLLTSG
jgi:Icc-related predicted phosphoesterase